MKKYILLFEDWKVKTFNIQDYWPNAEEMKEIEKVKKYFIWWYSHPDVISKIKSKDPKNTSTKLVDYIKKKLIPSEFRIFRTKKEEDRYWKDSGDNPNNNAGGAIAWVFTPAEPIYCRKYNNTESLHEAVLHEFAHLIQMFAGESLSSDLHNPTAPKGLYGTDSIKSGLFLPPLDPNGFDKEYEIREIEQFARFHTIRYYFGIQPKDDCNQIYQKVKTAIDEQKLVDANGVSFMRIVTIHGKHYLFISKILNDFQSDLYWYFEAYKKPTKDEPIFKKYYKDIYIESYEKLIYLYEYFIELDVICHDHKNIVSNFDIKETSFA